ncbi:MAG: ketoacyl-ACP synthase III [Ignavibacteria bacterium]|nr:ketoacyl-ACP synthase III [Ignavibacteria bacterium]
MPITISSIAHYVPQEIFPNSYFEDKVETSDEWIQSRTGIKERRFLMEGELSDMLLPAVEQCLSERGIGPEEIDCVIVATITPDNRFPSASATLQHKAGMTNAWGYDLSAACSGFLYALMSGVGLIDSGTCKKVLVCGGDKMSSILNFNDRTTCILFGDGGGVALLEKTEDQDIGIQDSILRIDGEGGQYLYMSDHGDGAKAPFEKYPEEVKEHYVIQDGQSVFKSAVVAMADVSAEIMERNNLTSDDIAWLVPHQANLRIIDATARRMGLDPSKVIINIDKYGNTTAGTIPICLSELHHQGKLNYGDKVILASFGAGYTWGSILLTWGIKS